MKKRKLIIIAIIIAIILGCSAIAVNATMSNDSFALTIKKVSEENLQEKIVSKIDNAISERVLEFLKTSSIKKEIGDLSLDKCETEFIKDNISNEEYYSIKTIYGLLYVSKDGIVTTYLNSNPEVTYKDYYIKHQGMNIKNEASLEKNANDIFYGRKLVSNPEDYSFTKIVVKDTYFPTAWYKSDVDNRELFFAFNPENLEILNMGNKKIILSQGNEVKINESLAKKVAMKQMAKDESDIIKVELSEVIPNDFFMDYEKGYFYSEVNYKRNAFIVTFNDKNSIQVYVDATTGEVIGGNGLW